MFTVAFNTLSGYLNRRFLVTIWLPTWLFWTALLSIVLMQWKVATVLAWWNLQSGEIQALIIILALGWITFFAYLLNTQIGNVLRFYEGYWNGLPFGQHMAQRRKAFYVQVIDDLDTQGDLGVAEIYYAFPEAKREVMPTRLGNHLRTAEVYPFIRYHINAAVVWPRLYTVLPDRVVEQIAEAKSQLDLMIVISFLGALFGMFGGILSLVLLPWYGVPAAIWGGVFIAWAGYRGAIGSALPYTELIKSAFDLHRATLLKTIGWNQATSYGKECEQWEQISALWYLGAPEGAEGARHLGYPTSALDHRQGIAFE